MPAYIATFNSHTFKESGVQYPLPDVAEVATYHRIAGGGRIRQSGATNPTEITLSRDALVTLAEYTALAGDVGTTAALVLEHITGSYTLRSLRGSPGELGENLIFIVTLELVKA